MLISTLLSYFNTRNTESEEEWYYIDDRPLVIEIQGNVYAIILLYYDFILGLSLKIACNLIIAKITKPYLDHGNNVVQH